MKKVPLSGCTTGGRPTCPTRLCAYLVPVPCIPLRLHKSTDRIATKAPTGLPQKHRPDCHKSTDRITTKASTELPQKYRTDPLNNPFVCADLSDLSDLSDSSDSSDTPALNPQAYRHPCQDAYYLRRPTRPIRLRTDPERILREGNGSHDPLPSALFLLPHL